MHESDDERRDDAPPLPEENDRETEAGDIEEEFATAPDVGV